MSFTDRLDILVEHVFKKVRSDLGVLVLCDLTGFGDQQLERLEPV